MTSLTCADATLRPHKQVQFQERVETYIFGSGGGAGISRHIRGKLNLLVWYTRWQCHEHLMTSRIGGVALNVCIRETEMVVIMTGAAQDNWTKTWTALIQRRVFHRTGALAIVFHRTLAWEEALSA